jgi:flagellar biosynthetic protein FlhB
LPDPSKTEKPTPHRIKEAREKGQIARSVEINSVVVLLTGLIAIRYAGPYMVDSMRDLSVFFYQNLNTSLGMENVYSYGIFLMGKTFLILAPVLGAILLMGLLVNYLQVGVLFSLKPITPKFTNINPINGFQRLFSRRSLVEFIKSILKLVIIGWIAYSGVKNALPLLVPAMDMQGTEALGLVGSLSVSILNRIIIVLLALAILDYLYQKWDYEDNLKMSKQEIRDEYKQSEGDPMIKARIRQIQREMARRRMFDAIPRADVVVTNPTHVAVALEYKDGMQTPMVLAKGERVVAERIKEMAVKHGIPIVQNPPLARALLKSCPVGAPISPDLFETVAEVLAYVYRLNKKQTQRKAAVV